jgi:hypothetical protein
VSTRNCRLVFLSVMKRRPVVMVQTRAAADVRCVSFPVGGRRRDEFISAPCHRNGGGTSRGWMQLLIGWGIC